MKKIGLLPRLVIAIILGIIIGAFLPKVIIRVFVTFNGIFGQFLSFAIPLIILGFVAPSIGDLGKGAGRILAVTAGIAYISTVFAGSLAYFANSIILPLIIDPDSISISLESGGNQMAKAFIEIQIPPLMGVMTALVLAFTLGIGIAITGSKTIHQFMNEFQAIITKLITNLKRKAHGFSHWDVSVGFEDFR